MRNYVPVRNLRMSIPPCEFLVLSSGIGFMDTLLPKLHIPMTCQCFREPFQSILDNIFSKNILEEEADDFEITFRNTTLRGVKGWNSARFFFQTSSTRSAVKWSDVQYDVSQRLSKPQFCARPFPYNGRLRVLIPMTISCIRQRKWLCVGKPQTCPLQVLIIEEKNTKPWSFKNNSRELENNHASYVIFKIFCSIVDSITVWHATQQTQQEPKLEELRNLLALNKTQPRINWNKPLHGRECQILPELIEFLLN